MRFVEERTRVSLIAGPGGTVCGLCTDRAAAVVAAVLIEHPRGGVVQLAVCHWCVQALRRLSAVSGGSAAFTLFEATGLQPIVPRGESRKPRLAGPPLLIMELSNHIQDAALTSYIVRVWGRGRHDGTWEGWLEFGAIGSPNVVLRTGRETTQSTRRDLVYWATGLEPAYIRGAFARAVRGPSLF